MVTKTVIVTGLTSGRPDVKTCGIGSETRTNARMKTVLKPVRKSVQTTKLTFLILTVTAMMSCTAGLTSKPKQSVYLFKDKDGLYLFDPATEKEKIIFKATEKQVFLDEPLKINGDTLTFGIKGDLVFSEKSPTEPEIERYFKDYYSVNMKTGENWLSRKILYEIRGHSTLNIKVLSSEISGKTKVLSDTSLIYKGSSTTSKGVVYNTFEPRFFSQHSIGDKSVFSLRGSIYYKDKSDTTLLVEYKGHFDPKFGNGYFQPQLDPTGQYAIFHYLPGFMNFEEDASLHKVNIQTKKSEILKTGDFNNPTFSTDGKFILFSRDRKEGELNTWISTIYLLELTTLKELKIGNAYSAQWGQ